MFDIRPTTTTARKTLSNGQLHDEYVALFSLSGEDIHSAFRACRWTAMNVDVFKTPEDPREFGKLLRRTDPRAALVQD